MERERERDREREMICKHISKFIIILVLLMNYINLSSCLSPSSFLFLSLRRSPFRPRPVLGAALLFVKFPFRGQRVLDRGCGALRHLRHWRIALQLHVGVRK